MIIDCHVHVCGTTALHGIVSDRQQGKFSFRFMRWRLGLPPGHDEHCERCIERKLDEVLNGAEMVDKAVVLAFDGVHTNEGKLDMANTHLYVTNDYVVELCQRHPKMLFGASIHPYRPDALQELERCVKLGAVLIKWLPIVQDFNPADDRCLPFYEALAHYRMPLLSHTGGEQTLVNLNPHVADPMLLVPALKKGVTVIAAHCATRSTRSETDFLPNFLRMVHEHENLYGDTSALCLPTRSYAFPKILADEVVRRKLVHGSDWPVIAIPPLQIGFRKALRLLRTEPNWVRRDVLIKRELGFDDAYWHRAATLLRWPDGVRP